MAGFDKQLALRTALPWVATALGFLLPLMAIWYLPPLPVNIHNIFFWLPLALALTFNALPNPANWPAKVQVASVDLRPGQVPLLLFGALIALGVLHALTSSFDINAFPQPLPARLLLLLLLGQLLYGGHKLTTAALANLEVYPQLQKHAPLYRAVRLLLRVQIVLFAILLVGTALALINRLFA